MSLWTYPSYSAANWLFPPVFGAVTSFILYVLPDEPYLFIVSGILGVNKCEPEEESIIEEYTSKKRPKHSIEDEEKQLVVMILEEKIDIHEHRIWGFLIWLLTSLIFTLFWTIIFETIVLAVRRVTPDDACPSYPSDCYIFPSFGTFTPTGPFNCIPAGRATFNTSGSIVCYSWIITSRQISDVLNVLGICGGLLCIIRSFIPFIYCLSYDEKSYPYSICYGFVVAFLAIIALILLYVFKVSFSFLSWFVLLFIAALSIMASILAHIRIRAKKNARTISSAETNVSTEKMIKDRWMNNGTITRSEQRSNTMSTISRPEQRSNTMNTLSRPEQRSNTMIALSKPEQRSNTMSTPFKPEQRSNTISSIVRPEKRTISLREITSTWK